MSLELLMRYSNVRRLLSEIVLKVYKELSLSNLDSCFFLFAVRICDAGEASGIRPYLSTCRTATPYTSINMPNTAQETHRVIIPGLVYLEYEVTSSCYLRIVPGLL